MGERIQQIAGIVFALAFVAILALISTTVLDIGDSVNDQLTRTQGVTEMRELRAFDDTKVTGDTVISAIRNYDALYTYDLKIEVQTSGGLEEYGACDNPSDLDNTNISPAKAYSAELKENANGVVTTIYFEEVAG